MTLTEDMQLRIKKCEEAKAELEDLIAVKEVDLMMDKGRLQQATRSLNLCKNRLKKAEAEDK